MRLLVLVAVLAPSLARAEVRPRPPEPPSTIEDAFPPTIRVGAPSSSTRIERVSFERGEVAWLAIELRQPTSFEVELRLPIDLPAGTRVIGFELDRDDRIVWGRPLVERAATVRYLHSMTPALVSSAGTTGGEEHVVVAVKNATRHSPITVTLALELPAISNLHVEPHRQLVVDGRRATGPTSLAIAPPEAPTGAAAVDPRTSLLAEPDAEIPAFERAISRHDWFTPSIDKHIIRRTMKAHEAQLRQCYVQVAQRHPEVEGKAELHFLIEDDGRVSVATADGELANDDVKACLVRLVSAFEFPPAIGGGRVQVNYPFEFRLNR